jgi:hypothetical protein
MLLTLVVVPVSYLVTDNMTAFFGRLFRRRRAGQTDAAGSVPEKQLATEEVEA